MLQMLPLKATSLSKVHQPPCRMSDCLSISSISTSAASAHQQHQWISSISASAASAASAHQQHQRISSISASVTCIGKDICPYTSSQVILAYISPDLLQTPPDTIRQGPDTTTHHQIPPHMHNVWLVWSKTSYSGDKWRCYKCGTNEQTNKQMTSKDSATQHLICEPLSFAMGKKYPRKLWRHP